MGQLIVSGSRLTRLACNNPPRSPPQCNPVGEPSDASTPDLAAQHAAALPDFTTAKSLAVVAAQAQPDLDATQKSLSAGGQAEGEEGEAPETEHNEATQWRRSAVMTWAHALTRINLGPVTPDEKYELDLHAESAAIPAGRIRSPSSAPKQGWQNHADSK